MRKEEPPPPQWSPHCWARSKGNNEGQDRNPVVWQGPFPPEGRVRTWHHKAWRQPLHPWKHIKSPQLDDHAFNSLASQTCMFCLFPSGAHALASFLGESRTWRLPDTLKVLDPVGQSRPPAPKQSHKGQQFLGSNSGKQ